MMKLQYFAIHVSGGGFAGAKSKGQASIYAFVQQQAFIDGVSDVFRLAAITVILSVIPVFFLRNRKKVMAQRMRSLK